MALNIVNTADAFAQATAAHLAGRLADAERGYQRVLQADPQHAGAMLNYGVLAFQAGRPDVALPLLQRAADLAPGNAAVPCTMGDVYAAAGRMDEAIAAYERALALTPDLAVAYNNLGTAYSRLGQVSRAIAAWEKALALADRPTGGTAAVTTGRDGGVAAGGAAALTVAALNNLGTACLQALDADKAVAAHRRALALAPAAAAAHTNLLRDLNYLPDLPPDRALAEHRAWWTQHAAGIQPLPAARPADPDRRLRVGFVSADFREHSVAHFLLPLFDHLDRTQFDLAAYAAVARPDEFTAAFQKQAAVWRSTLGVPDDALARTIQADGVDVLIDLSGHTADGRLRVFAYKPAPVQISYLGYPMTTGGAAVGYRIGDDVADPPGLTESHYAERLARLPGPMWCYRPPVDVPAQELAPSRRGRPFTFGSFNDTAKLSPRTLDLWARVLAAVPESRLLLKAGALADDGVRGRVLQELSARGVPPDRVSLLARRSALADHFAAYHDVDLALDTFPYTGTTTTCEALWMNVPVLTRAGHTHITRVGASLLTHAGLPELVALSDDAFVRTAADLARSPEKLAALRHDLRGRLRASPVMNERDFARRFGALLRTLWKDWCGGASRG
jgi:predicted O-linked N-acetylglucosamine transferase (SPINDLY family)